MKSNKLDLLNLLEEIRGQEILVIGDIMLDRYVWGEADRVSAEAPVLVVDVKKKDERLGGAGNVVDNLLSLGVKVNICAVVGDDYYGNKIITRLENSNVNTDGILRDSSRQTSTKKRVVARGQQVVRIDNEDKHPISPEIEEQLIRVINSKIESVQGIIVSDYGKGLYTKSLSDYFLGLVESKKINLRNKPLVVDPKPQNKNLYKNFSVIKPNRKEAEEISGCKIVDPNSALKAARIIKNTYNVELVLISLGADGLLVLSEEHPEGYYSDTLARKVFDVSGAGDTLVSAFTAGIITKCPQILAADLANICCAVVVSEVGTVPVNYQSLISEINKICQN